MFHPPDTAFYILVPSFQPVCGPLPGVEVAVIELLLIIGLDRNRRFGFHDQGRDEINPGNRPESAQKQNDHRDGPHPKHGEIEMLGDTSTNSQYDPVSGAVKSSA